MKILMDDLGICQKNLKKTKNKKKLHFGKFDEDFHGFIEMTFHFIVNSKELRF
jgi:hypothetical protein